MSTTHLDFLLQFDEVGRPLHDDIVADTQVLQRPQFGQLIGQLVYQVVGQVQTDQISQLFDVFGQPLEVIAGQVELCELIE